VTDEQLTRLKDAVLNVRDTSFDYYDGQNVWCLYCRATRPSPNADADLSWHDSMCVWRVAHELS